MSTPTKKQITTNRRVAARGAGDLSRGRMTPRALRCAIAQGMYAMSRKRPPEAPPEWREWKRERFQLSIRAAHLFLRGKDIEQIGPLIGKGEVGPDITRQRISQMIGEGTQFLLDRRFITSATGQTDAA